MMVPFPVLTFVDIANSLESHNLWPLEFVIYTILTLPCISGALLGSYVEKRIWPTKDD